MLDSGRRRRIESTQLLLAQNHALKLIADGAPLRAVLDYIVLSIEDHSPGVLCSVLLLDADGKRLRHGSAPNLPDAYTRSIDGAAIGPLAGSCGTAAFRGEPVVVRDIATDPLWTGYRDLALEFGLCSCWSTPIFDDRKNVLGTFACYCRSPRRPTARDWRLIGFATQTAAIAILRSRETEALRVSEQRLRLAVCDSKTGIWEWDVLANCLIWTEELIALFQLPPGKRRELTLEDFIRVIHPDDRSRIQAALRTSVLSGGGYEEEYRLLLPDGTCKWIASKGAPQFGAGGKVVRMLGTAMDVTARKNAEQELKEHESQLADANAALAAELDRRTRVEKEIRVLSARLIDAQEQERGRISRELHDDFSQQIAALSIATSNLKRGIGETGELRSQADKIQRRLSELAEMARRLSHQLHPAVLQHSGLPAALRSLCSEQARLTPLRVSLETRGSFEDIAPPVALCVYRVAQEALQNVVKHANVSEAKLVLVRSPEALSLTVSDAGNGFSYNVADARKGLGLISIRERARLLNGTVVIDSRPNEGTAVTLNIPEPVRVAN